MFGAFGAVWPTSETLSHPAILSVLRGISFLIRHGIAGTCGSSPAKIPPRLEGNGYAGASAGRARNGTAQLHAPFPLPPPLPHQTKEPLEKGGKAGGRVQCY